jgi:hypothetical protein
VDIVGKLCRIYVQALFSSSVTDFLWVLLVNFVGFTYKRCLQSLPTIPTGNQWQTKRTTLVRKPNKVYQQYPHDISDGRREQHVYVNTTKFTNNSHRKSVADEENNACFLWVLLVNFVGFTYKCCSLRLSLIVCVYSW